MESGVQQSILWAGSKDQFLKILINISDDGSVGKFNQQYFYINYAHTTNWYLIQEFDILIIPNDNSVTLFFYSYGLISLNLCFKSDGISKRFIRQKDDLDLIIFPSDNQLMLYKKGVLGIPYKKQKARLSKQYRLEFNSIYRVKDCDECLFLKVGEDSEDNHFILTVPIFPFDAKDFALDITQSYKLKWNMINLNLDPFYINESVWVVLAFPKKQNSDYLFQLINAYSQKVYNLTSKNPDDNKKQTSFALVSIEDKSNLEIIGVDVKGTIYVWDLNIPTLTFKYSVNFNSCTNSEIGDIFQYQQLKRLIISCGDYTIYSFDFVKGKAQQLVKLSYHPLSLRCFSKISIAVVGDRYSGDAHIYKFNSNTKLFEFFLTITTGNFKDILLSVELLIDNTLWIQYQHNNLFYSLQDCINDKNICIQCTQSYYFEATNQLSEGGGYGLGSKQYPFTYSANFFTSIIKAQYYKEIVSGVSNMNVDIIVEPNLIMKLDQELLNFNFNSVISLTFKSQKDNEFASLMILNSLKLQSYNSIKFQDILILFDFDKNKQSCGLSFIDIHQVILNNIKLQALNDSPISCQQIFVESSQLQILKYHIYDEDFSQSSSIISTFNSTKIGIKDLSLKNCIFGERFNILNQLTNLEANIEKVYITDNKCSTQNEDNQIITSLFSAGLFNVKDFHITGNKFCKKTIFSTLTLLQHTNQVFDFQDIEIQDNFFQTRTNYIFFNSLYSMRSNPSHELRLTNFILNNNYLTKNFKEDLSITSFIQTNKISKITIQNVVLQNHFDIQLGLIEYAQEVNINEFECSNDDKYVDIKNKMTIGCIQLNEINSVKINKINIENKKANDNSLFILENFIVQEAILQITNGEFNNLVLNQQKMNTFANPIYIGSSYQIVITLDHCNFKNNILKGMDDSLTYSTTAIWIENYVGQVKITNSNFENSNSDSIYGFIYIQSYSVQIENVVFKKSSFLIESDSTEYEMFQQNGGMMNLKVKTVSILNSSFSQATALVGSFIYFSSFGKQLKIDIKNTHFEEGYSQLDGSSLFIDTHGTHLIFNCIDCFFKNLYNFNPKSSVIGIEKYQKSKSDELNIISFDGGNIINTHGSEDNYFIEVVNTKILFNNIKKIYTENLVSSSLPHQKYEKIQIQQPSTLLNLVSSTADLIKCSIKDIKINNQKATFPLLINSQKSQINFDNTSVQDCIFVTSTINSLSSTITFKKTTFSNVNQNSQSRFLGVSEDLQPNQQASSLIIISNGVLTVQQDSLFSNINCLNNCNGGVFQLLNSSFSIQDTSINNSQATFGGTIFVLGIKDDNFIQNVSINNGKSQNDGGAIYLKAGSSDKFSLLIDGSKFLNNESIDGKGGAIMIQSESLNSPLQSIILTNSIISKNKAKIGGGLKQTNISVDIKDSTKIEKNIGEIFGNDEVSYPSHLRLSNLNEFLRLNPNAKVENNLIVIEDFRSGGKLENLEFEFLNDKNEKIIPITQMDFNSYSISVRFNPTTQNIQSYSISSETTTSYNTTLNSFSFRELVLIGTPLSNATLQFTSDQIKVLNKKTNQYVQNYLFLVQINFRNCTSGEEQTTNYNGETLCQICEPGFYSYFVNDCQKCPTGTTCKGGSDMEINYGYWRNTNVSSLVIECSNLLENCSGGSYGNNICFEGHIGALCEECDIYGEYWGTSYSKSAKFSCTKCDEIKNNLWIVILLTVWTQISISLAIKGGIQEVREKAAMFALKKNLKRKQSNLREQRNKQESMSQKVSQINSNKKEKLTSIDNNKSGIYIKMLTNYLQIAGSIATFNLQIPSGIFEFPESVGEPLRQTMNSLDCALKDLDVSIPIIYLRLIFSFFIPFAYMILFLIGLTVYYIIKKEKKFPWFILTTAIMFLIIYVQPDLVAQIIALMSCRTVGESHYILSNVSFECHTDEHVFYILVLIAPLLLLWVFILPLILFLILRKNKSQLNTLEIKLKYGFLYREYTKYAFYWEFIKMIEKIAIILCLNFYSQSIPTKAILVLIIIVAYGILSMFIEPYKDLDVNQVDVNSTNVCAVTVLLGLFLYNNPYDYYKYISLILVVLINLWFIVKIIKKIVSGYIPMIEQTIGLIIEKLSNRFTYFLKFVKTKKEKRINPELKKKVQKIFHLFIKMKPKKKRALVMKILENRLIQNYGHIYGDVSDSLDESQKEYFETSYKIKDLGIPLQDIGTPSTILETPLQILGTPLQDQGTPSSYLLTRQQLSSQDSWELDKQKSISSAIQMRAAPSIFQKMGNIKMNKDNYQLNSEPENLIKKDEHPEMETKMIYTNSNENMKGDDILINFNDSSSDD